MNLLRSLLLISLFALSPSIGVAADSAQILSVDDKDEFTCVDDSSIKDHMARNGQLMVKFEELSSQLQQNLEPEERQKVHSELKVTMQELRLHLHAVFVMTPDKLAEVPPDQLAKAQLKYQKMLAHMIWNTVLVEEKLQENVSNPMDLNKQQKELGDLLFEMGDLAAKAHSEFRD